MRVVAETSGTIDSIHNDEGDVVDEDALMFTLVVSGESQSALDSSQTYKLDAERDDLNEVYARHALGLDENRPEAVAKRHQRGNRMARENIDDLCDPGSFQEFGALAIAAQRRRRSVEDLMEKTPADGMVAGFGSVNGEHFDEQTARCGVLAYDYTVLAGTQGHHNHKKKDRLFELAERWEMPIVFYTEGGGGRPGDVDTDDLFMSWLDIKTFTTWAAPIWRRSPALP